MKRILFLSPLPPPHYGSAMSSEMCLGILEESKGFKLENIKLNYSREMGDVGKINLNKIRGIMEVRRQIMQKIEAFKPEKIYFVPATTSFGLLRDWFFSKEIKKLWDGKIIFHIRSRILNKDWQNPFKRKIIHSMLKGQRAIILGGELIGDLHGLISMKDISILPNAIENEISEREFERIMKLRKQRGSFNILFLSNMTPSKGWVKLLEACKILKSKKVKFKCNFVGGWEKGKDKKKFENFLKKNNLQDNVNYLGKKTRKDKIKILEESDMLVFPTEYPLETFGRVIVEGMMVGLPVIANGIATIPSIIENGKTGFILERNTPSEIAERIVELEDKKLREEMGKRGRKRFLERFELRDYKRKFLGIISSNNQPTYQE